MSDVVGIGREQGWGRIGGSGVGVGGLGLGWWERDTGQDLTAYFLLAIYFFPFEAIVLVTCFDYSPVSHVLFWVLKCARSINMLISPRALPPKNCAQS